MFLVLPNLPGKQRYNRLFSQPGFTCNIIGPKVDLFFLKQLYTFVDNGIHKSCEITMFPDLIRVMMPIFTEIH